MAGLVAGVVAAGLMVAAPSAQAAPAPFTVRMVPVHSGLSLTVAGTTSGSRVVQDITVGLSGTLNRRWRLDFTGGSVAQIRSEGVAQNRMEPSATAAGGGTVIVVRPCADPNDIFTPPIQFWRERQSRLPNGDIVSRWQNAVTGQFLAIENASRARGARLIRFPASGGANHQFDHIQ